MSRRCRFSRLRTTVVLAAIAAVSTVAPRAAADAADRDACDAALPVRWIDGWLAPATVLDAAERESSRIWASAGVALEWRPSPPGGGISPDEILVMVRTRLDGQGSADAHGRHRKTLGRLLLASPEQPTRLIEVALPEIAAQVSGQRLLDRPVRDLPKLARDAAIGRGLGRVVAHEIGHWLFGRGHAPDGLMRASIRRGDLIGAQPPPLPSDWPSTARARLQARRPCPAPRIVRQPVAS